MSLGVAVADPVSEKNYLDESPVVLSASKLAQPLSEAPVAVTIIDREMIKASGFRLLADVFRLVPGMYVGYVNGNAPVISYHGFTNEYSPSMQVLVDGRSVYTPLFGGAEWSDLPLALEDIERIEVIRGPNAASFGANSFLGVVNIITQHAAQAKGAYAAYRAGSEGINDVTLRYGGGTQPLDFRLTLATHNDNGFDARYDRKRVNLLNLRSDYALNNQDSVQFQFGGSDNERDRGFEDCGNQPDCDRVQTIHSDYQYLRWQRSISADDELSIQFYHNNYRSSDGGVTPPYPQFGGPPQSFVVENRIATERYDLELQQVLSPRPNWRWVWGASVRTDTVNAPLLLSSRESVNTRLSRLFGHAEWRVTQKLLLQGGALLEQHNWTGSDISPRFAANYRIGQQHTLRASYSRALRTPTVFEEKANLRFDFGMIQIQPNLAQGGLKPEAMTSKEIGYIGNFPNQKLQVDVKLFRDELSRLVAGTVVPFPAAINGMTINFVNDDTATMRGAEAQFKFRPSDYSQIIANLARVHINSNNPGLEATPPRNMISLLAMLNLPQQVAASLGYYQVSQRGAESTQPFAAATPVPGYKRLDVRLAKQFRYGNRVSEIELVAQNLMRPYQDFRYDNQFDRRVYVTLSTQWP